MKKLLTITLAIFTLFLSSFLTAQSATATDTPTIQVTAGEFGLCREPGEKTVVIEIIFPYGLPLLLARDMWLESLGIENMKSTATFFVLASQIEDITIQLHSQGHWENVWVNWAKTSDGLLRIVRSAKVYSADQFKIVVTANGEEYELPLGNADLQPLIKLFGCSLVRDGMIEIK